MPSRYEPSERWCDLPPRYGNGRGAHKRFRRWTKAGVRKRIAATFLHLAGALLGISYKSIRPNRKASIGRSNVLAASLAGALFITVLFTAAADAVELSGVHLPEQIQVDNRVLTLTSCGVRDTLWIDHYVAALYVPPDLSPAKAVQDEDTPKLVLIEIVNPMFLPDDIPEKWRTPLQAELPREPMTRIRQIYGQLQAGDVITASYAPQQGLRLEINGRLIATEPGHDLIDAMLSAWAEPDPISGKLNRLLLEHPCKGD